MHASRFDIAILGDSLAARMAAAILAKHGKRVLCFSAPSCRDAWHHSSLFVDKILASLGSCEPLPPNQPFQVLTSRARVTISPDLPLSAELSREFGEAAPAIGKLLATLDHLGATLEGLFCEHGGVPLDGLVNSARWRWLCLRRKLPLGVMTAPLSSRLHAFPDTAAEWLRDLFQGLALRPLETLTIADGALLWTQAGRSNGLTDEWIEQLLQKRFEQFHGVEAGLETLRSCEYSDGHWVCSLQRGGRFLAEHLIIGDLGREIPGREMALSRQGWAPTRYFMTSALAGQLSPLLAQRVILGGALPLRLAVDTAATGQTGQVGTLAGVDEIRVRQQLDGFLPFARYELTGAAHDHGARPAGEIPAAAPLPLCKLPFRQGNHLWCADDTRLLPQLGTGGAALLAWTLARQIDPASV